MNLACMYAEGLGYSKNLEEGTQLFEEAAEAREFLALELARMYTGGVAGPRTLSWLESGMRLQRRRKPARVTARSCKARRRTAGSLPEGRPRPVTCAALPDKWLSAQRKRLLRSRRNVEYLLELLPRGGLKAGYIPAQFIGVEDLPHCRLKARELGSEIGS